VIPSPRPNSVSARKRSMSTKIRKNVPGSETEPHRHRLESATHSQLPSSALSSFYLFPPFSTLHFAVMYLSLPLDVHALRIPKKSQSWPTQHIHSINTKTCNNTCIIQKKRKKRSHKKRNNIQIPVCCGSPLLTFMTRFPCCVAGCVAPAAPVSFRYVHVRLLLMSFTRKVASLVVQHAFSLPMTIKVPYCISL
jgi:hypothetical protein